MLTRVLAGGGFGDNVPDGLIGPVPGHRAALPPRMTPSRGKGPTLAVMGRVYNRLW